MRNNKGFATTISVFLSLTFSILLISYIVFGINQQNNNINYIDKKVRDKLDNKNIF